MEIESNYPKYAGRVPPLDLSQVNASCRTENDLQHLWSTKTDIVNSESAMQRNSLQNPYSHHHTHLSLSNSNGRKNGDAISLQHLGSDGLPVDPRDWTRADVWKWLINMAVSEGLEVTPELPQKFPMNGKALCLMSLDMYLCRVPVGGKMLYRDFRVRLARAMALLS
ncbi:uncharacterized protein LOC119685193 isoform X2 [Teleopsis dalmanni]|nr:uncharacterized protein LOC119685193 isoform X2 [Teleopsis dalmanni]